jgi:hypothetical protein
MKVLAFTATMEKAKTKIVDVAKEFIIENEGKKKIESVFQEDKFDPSKLIDGYYFVKRDNSIEVYKKNSSVISQSGWLGSYQNIQIACEKVGIYTFVEFDNNLLNQFIDTNHVNKTVIQQETKIIKVDSFDSVIRELCKNGFKNHLKKTNSKLI